MMIMTSDVTHRVIGLKWRDVSYVLSSTQIPQERVNSIILYYHLRIIGLNIGPLNMLRRVFDKTIRDQMHNNFIRAQLVINLIKVSVKNTIWLVWTCAKRYLTYYHEDIWYAFLWQYKKGWGRSKRIWVKLVRQDLEKLKLNNDMVCDWMEWRKRSHNPTWII